MGFTLSGSPCALCACLCPLLHSISLHFMRIIILIHLENLYIHTLNIYTPHEFQTIKSTKTANGFSNLDEPTHISFLFSNIKYALHHTHQRHEFVYSYLLSRFQSIWFFKYFWRDFYVKKWNSVLFCFVCIAQGMDLNAKKLNKPNKPVLCPCSTQSFRYVNMID